MPDNADPFTPSQVHDKREKPPGILPKNTQAWVLSGVAFLMVAVIALSGKNPQKERGASASPPPLTPVDANAGRIQEYQRRIEEQARKLQLEQAQLTRTQQTLGVAPNTSAGVAQVGAYPGQSYPSGSSQRAGELRYAPAEPSPTEDAIQADKKKREYQSLFAPNVVLSYRKGPPLNLYIAPLPL